MKFKKKLEEKGYFPLKADGIRILQVNMGYLCNMACKHCHVQAGPSRDEIMQKDAVDTIIDVLGRDSISTLDITGGAPELNPYFRYLVSRAREMGKHVIARSNLTVFFEEGVLDMPDFLHDHNVEVIASLPYYTEENVDRVRGTGAFKKSIDALKKLNELGYGSRNGFKLNLVYNPQGAFLPPMQSSLEEYYRKGLYEGFGIEFNDLYTFTNMPIGRFLDFLKRTSRLDGYMEMLADAFNYDTLCGVMCRSLLSVGWDGSLYDCDFNQTIGLGLNNSCPQKIFEYDPEVLLNREIAVDDHCFGCTAGQGST